MSQKVKINKLIFGGSGLGKIKDGKTIFVAKSVPGDELEVEIVKDQKSYSSGYIKKIILPSADRVVPPCPYFNNCGGCDHQNISYTNQLKYKQSIFNEVLSRAHVNSAIAPIIAGSNEPLYYRNSIRFFFIHKENDQIAFGRSDFLNPAKLIEIDSCLLQSETANLILAKLKDYLNNLAQSKGSLWQLKIRQGKFSNEFMVELITSAEDLPGKEGTVKILKNISTIKSIYHTVAPGKSLRNLSRHLIFGSPLIHEKIGPYTFQISPESFFQTNSLGVKTLYDVIKKYAEIKMGDTLLDLYSGTGTIGIYLSALAKTVTAVESVPEAVSDAKDNARLNKIKNVEFVCSDVHKYLISAKRQFNVVVIDPPRAGLNASVIKLISKQKFDRLVYVSCNPSTFSRDIKLFENYGLTLIKVQPIDMFPQTHHLEVVGQLRK